MSVTIPLVCLLHRSQQLPLITNVFFFACFMMNFGKPPHNRDEGLHTQPHIYITRENLHLI